MKLKTKTILNIITTITIGIKIEVDLNIYYRFYKKKILLMLEISFEVTYKKVIRH